MASEYGLGYAITREIAEGTERATKLLAAMRQAHELEAAYVLQPELRPEPDPYVWIDPWEGR